MCSGMRCLTYRVKFLVRVSVRSLLYSIMLTLRVAAVLVCPLFGSSLALGQGAAPAKSEPTQPATTMISGDAWTFTLPQTWEDAPQSMLDAANHDLASRAAGGPSITSYVRALVRRGEPPEGRIYMLVQEMRVPTAGFTLSDLAKVHGQESTAENIGQQRNKVADIVADASQLAAVFDSATARFTINSNITLSGGDVPVVFRTYTMGAYHSAGVVQLNIYSPIDRFAAIEPEVKSISDSLTIKPGREFKPASELASTQPEATAQPKKGGGGAAVIAAVALAGAVTTGLLILRKRKDHI